VHPWLRSPSPPSTIQETLACDSPSVVSKYRHGGVPSGWRSHGSRIPWPPDGAQVKQTPKFAAKCLLLLAVVLILAGITYEQVGERLDRKRFPQVGRSVDIGGRSLNIYCSGSGGPAVILDTGGSAPGYENSPLQMQIAEFAQACWFDRAGLGWSDPSPMEQTSAAIAEDLHALLHAAAVPPPYVLVGASFSGFHVRVFAGKYRPEVGGVVLVDSAHEDQYGYEPRATLAPVHRLPKPIRSLLCLAVPLGARVGIVRLLSHRSQPFGNPLPGFTAEQEATLQGLEAQPKSIAAGAVCHFEEKNPAQARAAGGLGDLPLLVLTAGQPLRTGESETDKELVAFHEMWVHQLQPQLARLSTRGRQIIVENSGHSIDRDEVSKAIRKVVMQVRERSGRVNLAELAGASS
jgi:pimeloyl-ACP methyl ester carboxylesterase